MPASSLETRFVGAVEELALGPGVALVAVSGGADSLALLDLLVRTRDHHELSLRVAHVDHGIAPDSETQSARVQATADRYHLPYDSVALGLGAASSETTARRARHRALEDMRLRHEARYLMLAHQADDQIETVLMRVLGGSGPAGLAGMVPVSGPLVRPLLPFRRTELVRYLLERGIEWWDDPANEDMRHLRSWVRHQLLPTIEARLPEAQGNLAALAHQAGHNRAAWEAVLDVLPGVAWQDETDGGSVAAAGLAGYDSRLAGAVVQAAGRRVGCAMGLSRAAGIIELAGRGRSGATLELPGGWRVELSFGRLRFIRPAPVESPARVQVGQSPEGCSRWGRWQVSWHPETAPERQVRGGTSAWFVPGPLVVREPVAGDRIVPLGGTGHRRVVRCLQEARVPRSRRTRWPVVEADGDVVWVPGVCRSNELVPEEGANAIRVDVRYC